MKGKILLILALVCVFAEIVSAVTDKLVCYHGSWSKYRSGNGKYTVNDIDPNLCTHIIYSFVGMDSTTGAVVHMDEYLDVTTGNIKNFVALKAKNANLKTLVAVGGWNEGSVKYSKMAASATLRTNFIQTALAFVKRYGFDGFDLDWEYPAQRGGAAADIENFVKLIKEFREVFDQHGLLLTAAVSASPTSVDLSYNVPALSQYLDLINVMTYDLHTSWDGATGQNAPLYASSVDTTAASKLLNVQACIKGWISRGADPQKLALGLGTYGRSYTLSNTANTGVGAASSGAGIAGPYTLEAGYLGYNEICEKQLAGGWTVVWDDEQKNPYAYNGNQWVGYDNPESIILKVQLAKDLNLGGVMIWALETEDFKGICGPKYPLLNAIKDTLGTSSNEKPSAATTSAAATTAAVTTAAAPTAAAATTAAPSSGTVVCKQTGYVRDPSNCNVFYYCSLVGNTYVPLKYQCTVGLYFDPTINACNWPGSVSGC